VSTGSSQRWGGHHLWALLPLLGLRPLSSLPRLGLRLCIHSKLGRLRLLLLLLRPSRSRITLLLLPVALLPSHDLLPASREARGSEQ